MSLGLTYDTDNIFAKILRGDMPCVKVYEDEQVLSFMDVFPQSRGHVLVIPKRASVNMLDTKPDTLAELIKATQKIAKAVPKAFGADGFILTQFNGAPAGQTVFHLHMHIIPCYNDQTHTSHASGKMADMDALQKLAKQLQAHL